MVWTVRAPLRVLFSSRNLKRRNRWLNIKTFITFNGLMTLILYVRLVDGNLRSLCKLRSQWQRKLYSSEGNSVVLQMRQTMLSRAH